MAKTQVLQSEKSRDKTIKTMKSRFLSEAIMSLLHVQGVNLAYESAAPGDYFQMSGCDCYGSCTGGCDGGCMGDCANGCFDGPR